ncbi:MAG: hypothetical protein A2X23_06330 [Chloroflexi bacterium GWC2_73_18]|nr:MAG: hypothetical protein A2X23_06330 [Chloroflexi bacterium GWC2_73_18]
MSDRQARPEPSPPAWLIWAALAVIYLVWGSTYLGIRVMVETLPPLLGAGVRFLVAGSVLAGWLILRRGPSVLRASRGELAGAAMIGAALLLGGNGLVSLAERTVPSALTALIIASTPLWIVVLHWLTRERVTRTTLIGVVVGFAGVAVLILPRGLAGEVDPIGMAMLVSAAAAWATGSLYSKRLALPADPFASAALQQLAGAVLLVAAGLALGEGNRLDRATFSARSVVALGYLTVFGSLLAFTAYTWLLQHAPISKVATYAYVNPIVAVILGWLILSEEITVTMLAGAGLVIGAVVLIVSRGRAPAAERPSGPGPERVEAEVAEEVAETGPVATAMPTDGR